MGTMQTETTEGRSLTLGAGSRTRHVAESRVVLAICDGIRFALQTYRVDDIDGLQDNVGGLVTTYIGDTLGNIIENAYVAFVDPNADEVSMALFTATTCLRMEAYRRAGESTVYPWDDLSSVIVEEERD